MKVFSKSYRYKILLLLSVIFFVFTVSPAFAADLNSNGVSDYVVNLYFFHGDGCPHCAEEEIFLEEMTAKYGEQLVIHKFEIWKHPENIPIIEQFAKAYGFEPSGVPVTFIGHEYWVGFSEEKKDVFENAIRDGIANGVVDPQDVVDGIENLIAPVKDPVAKITVPFFGEVDLLNQTLFVSTVIIGLVDGINPCSLWVLTMLLAMIVHTNSRKKTVIIGLVFLTVTAFIYALFITGVFTILTYASYLKWIQVIVAVITLVLGLINLKDYFFFKEGISLTIQDSKKPGIYQKMRNIMNSSENIWAMIGATVVLAAGVSLIEFSCTAAFPVVWSNLLVSHNATRMTFILLLLLYMLLYQLDELVIFSAAVITMKSSRLEEKHGQILKLFSGCLMVTLSLVMIINPAWMNNLLNTLVVFSIAIGITLIILLLISKILPRFGVHIGHQRVKSKSSKKPKKNTK
ncbi:MAG: hypothetical protein AB9907_11810 [Flexilinea sp.]